MSNRTALELVASPSAPDPTASHESDGVPSGPVGVAILGSTGSVGRQALEVIADLPDRFRVVALAAGRNHELLARQAARFRPNLVAADRGDDAPSLRSTARCVEHGADGLIAAATHPDAAIVLVATSGHAGIVPTARALEAGKTVALANKEAIVCAGELILPLAARHGVPIRPVDSEHSAIWQCLGRSSIAEVSRLILTASGGPFRDTPADQLGGVTVVEALAHPTWAMGGKVTIDSATLMNKGLEILEARWLFGVPLDQIDVLVHPESIVHSLVEFLDGSQIAQLGLPDMRLPIQYALTYPEHAPPTRRRLSLADVGHLRFAAPDTARFPALGLARQAGQAGDTYPTVLSAADDEAVAAFLLGRIRFTAIPAVVARVLEQHRPTPPLSFESIAEADRWARRTALSAVDDDRT